MWTSNFASVKSFPPELRPVGIAVKPPRWYHGDHEQRLAPRADMLRMSLDNYDKLFDAILSKLDAKQLYRQLGNNAVLLCWEPPGFSCHRRRVAEWFENRLDIEVPEYGFNRSDCPPYRDLPQQPRGTR